MNIETNVALAPFTTIGLGGSARWYAICNSPDDIIESLKWARSKAAPVHILGGGSNSLFADSGFPGLVIHMQIKGIEWHADNTVDVSAGENWDFFVQQAIEHGLAGIECLSGIPGLVGATPIQNVGAYGQEVKDTILMVKVLNRITFEVKDIPASDCHFSYRSSRFKLEDRDKFVVLNVTFKLSPTEISSIKYPELEQAVNQQPNFLQKNLSQMERLTMIRNAVLTLRNRKGMVVSPDDPDTRSLGSFFTNPIITTKQKDFILNQIKKSSAPTPQFFVSSNECWKVSAAWLIEQSGVKKGETHGKVRVSTKHTLALTNPGHGSTFEILALSEIIKKRVQDTFQVTLEQEPEYISGQ